MFLWREGEGGEGRGGGGEEGGREGGREFRDQAGHVCFVFLGTVDSGIVACRVAFRFVVTRVSDEDTEFVN